MANADRNLQDVVPQELNDNRSEFNQAIAAPETELQAARRPPNLEARSVWRALRVKTLAMVA